MQVNILLLHAASRCTSPAACSEFSFSASEHLRCSYSDLRDDSAAASRTPGIASLRVFVVDLSLRLCVASRALRAASSNWSSSSLCLQLVAGLQDRDLLGRRDIIGRVCMYLGERDKGCACVSIHSPA